MKMKKFKELTNIELYKILRLREEVFILEQDCIYPDVDGKDENAHHLMVFDGDEIIGGLRILNKGVTFEEICISRVVVAKKYRGKGIAKKIVKYALDFIKNELNERYVRISAQSYTIKFYEGVGFKVVSEEYLEDGIPHVCMFCDLEEV